MEVEDELHLMPTARFSEIDDGRAELAEKFSVLLEHALIATNEQCQVSLGSHVWVAYDRGVKPIDPRLLCLICLPDGSVWVDGAHLYPESSPLHAMQRPILSHDDAFDHVLVCERSNYNIDRLAQLVGRGMRYCSLCNQLTQPIFASIVDVDFVSFREKV